MIECRRLAVVLALVPAPIASAFELYLASDVGVSLLPNIRIQDIPAVPGGFGNSGIEVSADPGVAFSFAVGAKVTEQIGIEIQSGYVYNNLGPIDGGVFTSALGSTPAQNGDGWIQQVPVLFNVLFDAPIIKKESGLGELTLQVGGGIGLVYVDGYLNGVTAAAIPGASATVSGNDWTFGFQGTLALRWGITENIDLGVRYRFMGTTEANFGPSTFNTPLIVSTADVVAEAVYTNAIQASLEIRF